MFFSLKINSGAWLGAGSGLGKRGRGGVELGISGGINFITLHIYSWTKKTRGVIIFSIIFASLRVWSWTVYFEAFFLKQNQKYISGA